MYSACKDLKVYSCEWRRVAGTKRRLRELEEERSMGHRRVGPQGQTVRVIV